MNTVPDRGEIYSPIVSAHFSNGRYVLLQVVHTLKRSNEGLDHHYSGENVRNLPSNHIFIKVYWNVNVFIYSSHDFFAFPFY